MTREELATYEMPDEPGIYQFRLGTREKPGKLLYVGKAASLRDRVRSYFAKDLAETRSPSIVKMVEDATTIVWQETGSVLEALILEANLIKLHQPPYNVMEKDNKSYNYVIITKEDFPRVLVIRGRELFDPLKGGQIKKKAVFGPFPHGLQLQEAYKMIRKIFPFRDTTCTPCPDQLASKKARCRPCFNRQVGLCPGVCTGECSKEEYALTIQHISALFRGNFQGLKRQLAKEMKAAVAGEEFEKAQRLHRQITALEHIKDVSLIKQERVATGGARMRVADGRVEAYDVAHTAGTETVGVMTVVEAGEASHSQYRKFKIKTKTNDDTGSLTEVLERRLGHPEWPLPRVIAVDGGKGQVNAANRVLKAAGVLIPVVGVVKDDKHRPLRLIGDDRAIGAYERDILLANSEAHRYGIGWHRNRLRKGLTA